MIVELTEIFKTDKYTEEGKLQSPHALRQVFVNPQHVVCLREDSVYKSLLLEGRLVEGLDKEQSFTRLYLNRGQAGIDLIVVGLPSVIQEKLGLPSEKQLLKG